MAAFKENKLIPMSQESEHVTLDCVLEPAQYKCVIKIKIIIMIRMKIFIQGKYASKFKIIYVVCIMWISMSRWF